MNMANGDDDAVPLWKYMHSVDAYEKQRTAALRTVDRQVDLLADALHAMRNGHVATADEFVDRALTALRTTVVDLRHAPPEPTEND